MRLDKYLSNSKIGSRSEVKILIKKGKIKINDSVIKSPSYKVNKNDIVKYENEKIMAYDNIYIMLNKPKGYLSANKDSNIPVVLDLIDHPFKDDLSIAGRLDVDVNGLLILSNDGNYIHKIISPKKEVYKTYIIKTKEEIEDEKLKMLMEPMDLGDFITKKSIAKKLDSNTIELKITEGKYHQVKRMIKKVDLTLTDLKRTQIGSLKLTIEEGAYKEMSKEEALLAIRGE
jgi:16S rRNA pseudouridine516 synthase